MKLQRGLQVHQDDEVKKYEKADLNDANRDKTKTQKDLDAMLFGPKPVRPIRRDLNKSVNETPNKKPQEPVEDNTKKPSPFPPRTPPRSQTNRQPLVRNTERTDRSRFSRNSQRTEENLLESEEKPKQSEFNSTPKQRIIPERGRMKTEQMPPKKEQAPKKQQMAEKTIKQEVQVRGLFNRPTYVRKLKKIAQNFEYYHLNSQNHRYFDVIREVDCLRQTAMKEESEDFVDKNFPHTGLTISHRDKKQKFEWKKANTVFKRVGFGKYIDPNDIIPGKYSSKSFLSVLACLAEREENIKRLIENQSYKNNGFHYVRLNINAAWKYYTVDDYLPEINGEAVGARSHQDNESDLWVSLVEKAYAKAFGSYQIFERQENRSEQYLSDLTGSVVKKYITSDQNIKQIIEKSSKNKHVIVGLVNENIEELGLDKGYNLCIRGISSQKKIELRNSWGTIVEKPLAKLSKDGVFELTLEDFQKYFDYVLIAEANDFCTSTIQSKHEKSFYSCYTFEVTKKGQWNIEICQWDHKLFPSAHNYTYSPFHLLLQKRQKSGERRLITGGYTDAERNLSIENELQQGSYGIYCIGEWKQKSYNYHVTITGESCVNIGRVRINEVPNQIVRCLERVNLQGENKKSKGNMIQYIHFDQGSNLIVVSVQNSGEKNQNHNQDFSKIKHDLVQLITKISPQEETSRVDISKKKSVSVSVGPKESYTWVFTIRKSGVQNIRDLGFY